MVTAGSREAAARSRAEASGAVDGRAPIRQGVIRGGTAMPGDDAAMMGRGGRMDGAEIRLRALFAAALAAADPFGAVRRALPPRPQGRVLVLGAGKASARMAQAVEAEWGPCEGLVVVPEGGRLPLAGVDVVEAGHPLPDARSEAAARRALALAGGLGAGDLLLALVSGGGSALLAAPGGALALEDKQAVNRALLASGAPIGEMNLVRQHLSAIKGGRLAVAAWPARTLTLLVSDIPGDDPGLIASGPTLPARATVEDARAVVRRHGIELSPRVLAHLDSAAARLPPADHPAFAAAEAVLVARPRAMLLAAAEAARGMGLTPLILGCAIEGEAAEVGRAMAGVARSAAEHGDPAAAPCVLLSGGETTVTVRGAGGRGGRNSTFLLGLAVQLWDAPVAARIGAIACDSDGRDGSEANAGAIWLPAMRGRATLAEARDHLARLDAWGLFASVGGLVETGPTHTNVNDFRAVLVEPAP
jgi:glycerate-2-kinase